MRGRVLSVVRRAGFPAGEEGRDSCQGYRQNRPAGPDLGTVGQTTGNTAAQRATHLEENLEYWNAKLFWFPLVYHVHDFSPFKTDSELVGS